MNILGLSQWKFEYSGTEGVLTRIGESQKSFYVVLEQYNLQNMLLRPSLASLIREILRGNKYEGWSNLT